MDEEDFDSQWLLKVRIKKDLLDEQVFLFVGCVFKEGVSWPPIGFADPGSRAVGAISRKPRVWLFRFFGWSYEVNDDDEEDECTEEAEAEVGIFVSEDRPTCTDACSCDGEEHDDVEDDAFAAFGDVFAE